MPLSSFSLPTYVPERDIPFDQVTAFASSQALSASGNFSNIQQQVDIGVGRWTGKLAFDIFAMDLSSGDETYRIFLLGSNDPAFGNGNVEMLAARDWAAASAGRLLPTVLPASNASPSSGRQSSRFSIPVSNAWGIYVFRYLQLYAVLGGTTPALTASAWLAGDLS